MPISVFSILGDAIWIVAMSLIASSSQGFWRRLSADTRIPMQWSLKRQPTWRATRPLAFGLTVGVPLIFGLALSAAARDPTITPSDILLILLLRAFTGPIFVLIHYAWIRTAAATLDAEGELKP